ncbi:MAG: hypothetical protein RLO50_00870 [Azospirillaceae bacterium]
MTRPIAFLLSAFLVAFMIAALPVKALYLQAPSAVDPTVLVTNESGAAVTLTWQTTVPRVALSPPRTVEVPADAAGWRAPQGFFLFSQALVGDERATLENVVYVSLLGPDGSVTQQIVLDDEIALSPEALEALVLHLTIAADGALSAAIE